MSRNIFVEEFLKPSELNKAFAVTNILQIYEGTGFDASITVSGVIDTNSVELTEISASDVGDADYIIVDISFQAKTTGSGTINKWCDLKLEAKEIGGSYSTDYDKEVLQHSGGDNPDLINMVNSLRWVHTLTAGEKSNGLQFKITGTANAASNATGVSISNIQTIITKGV